MRKTGRRPFVKPGRTVPIPGTPGHTTHRVLIDSGADPKLIHPAIEEVRNFSGQNVISSIGAQITELRSEMQAQITELRSEMQAQINGLQAQITELRSEMKAQINGLQAQITALRTEMNTLNKIIWALISLLFVPMFGLLYKILTS